MSTKAIREVLMCVEREGDAPGHAYIHTALAELAAIERAAMVAATDWEYTGTSATEWTNWNAALDTLQAIAKEAP